MTGAPGGARPPEGSGPSARESGAKLFRREFDLEGETSGSTPVAKLCNLILAEGLEHGARAIRLRPADAWGEVDYETAGEWRTVIKVPLPAYGPLVNRLKIMAALDISRIPIQQGEVHVRLKGALRVWRIQVEVHGSHEHALLSAAEPSAG